MSTTASLSSARPLQEDPFRLGWRYVTRRLPDGSEIVDQVPLTEDDVLHPQEGDFIVQSHGHNEDILYLAIVFKRAVAHDKQAVVTGDLRMAWDDPDIRPLGPDITVIFGVLEERNWKTFDVADEGVRPRMIVEVTSDSTRKNDLGIKREYYHRLGIPYYIIADADDDAPGRPIRLIGLRYAPEDYVEMQPNDKGWLWLEPLGIWLGVGAGRLVCYDKDGKEIGDYTKVCLAYEAELAAREKQATNAEQRAAAADERVKAMERQLRDLEATLQRLQKGEKPHA